MLAEPCTRTTILAAANPVYGRYNPYKSPVDACRSKLRRQVPGRVLNASKRYLISTTNSTEYMCAPRRHSIGGNAVETDKTHLNSSPSEHFLQKLWNMCKIFVVKDRTVEKSPPRVRFSCLFELSSY